MKAAVLHLFLACPLFAGHMEDAAREFQSGDRTKAAEIWREHAKKGTNERRASGQAALLRGQYDLAGSLLSDSSLKEDPGAQECLSRAALYTGNDGLSWEAAKASVMPAQNGIEAERRLRRLLALSQLPPDQAKRTAELEAPDAPPELKAALLMLYNADYRKADAEKLAATLPANDTLCAEVLLAAKSQAALEKSDLPGAAALIEDALKSRKVPDERWYTFLATIRAQAGDFYGVVSAIQAWRRSDLKHSGPSLLMVKMFSGRPGSGDAFARDGVMAFPKNMDLLQAVAESRSISPSLKVSLLSQGWKAVGDADRYAVSKLLAQVAATTGTAREATLFLESNEAREADAACAEIARVFLLSAARKPVEAEAVLTQAEEKFAGHRLLPAARAALLGATGKGDDAMRRLEKVADPAPSDRMEYLWLALNSAGKPDNRLLAGLPVEMAVPFLEQTIPLLARQAKWERIVQILQPAVDSLIDSPLLLIELGRALYFTKQQEQAMPVLMEAMARLQVIHQPPPYQDPQKGLLPSDYRLTELMRDESRSLVDQERQGSPSADETLPAVRCLALLYRIIGTQSRDQRKTSIRWVNGIQRNTALPLAEDANTGELVLPHYQQHYQELWENSGQSFMAALWLIHRWDAPAIPHAAAEMVWKRDHGIKEWREASANVLAVHESTADPAPFLELCFQGEGALYERNVPDFIWPALAARLANNLQLPPGLAKKIGSLLGIGTSEVRGLCALRLRTPEELAGFIKDRFAGVHGSSMDYSVFGGTSPNEALTWLQKTPEQWARRKMADTLPHLANATQRLHVAILSGLDEEMKAALKEVRASTSPEDAPMASFCALVTGDVNGAVNAWLAVKNGTDENPWPLSEAANTALLAWSFGWELPQETLDALRQKNEDDLAKAYFGKLKPLIAPMLEGKKPTPEQSVQFVAQWRPLLRLASGVGERERGAGMAANMLRQAVGASLNGWQAKDSLWDFNIAIRVSNLLEPAWLQLHAAEDTESRWAAGYLAAVFGSELKEREAAEKLLGELGKLQPKCPLLERHLR